MTRIKLVLQVDLDPTPGPFHTAESARNIVASQLTQLLSPYNPTVIVASVEDFETTKSLPYVRTPYTREFDENSVVWIADNFDMNLVLITSQQTYFNHRLQTFGFVFLNEVHEALGLSKTPAGQLVGWLKEGDGDGYIDFGTHVADSNGPNPKITLDFNVDGVIYDKIGGR